jgi:hypothetical protein
MPRQLNIRSDEAAETARVLAEHLGATTTQVVIEALRSYSARMIAPSRKTTPEQVDKDWRQLRRMIKDANRGRPPGGSSDHDDLYDDFGAPR